VSNGEEKGGAQAGGKSNADFKRMFLGGSTKDDNNTAAAGAADGGSGGGRGAEGVDGQDVDMTSEGNGSKTD
jgi:N-methylhydantoinase B/oxoprolinase/acetone carboxylase alpha subunit